MSAQRQRLVCHEAAKLLDQLSCWPILVFLIRFYNRMVRLLAMLICLEVTSHAGTSQLRLLLPAEGSFLNYTAIK